MPDGRTLEIRLSLDSREAISPAEFLELFRCGDEFSRYIAQHEALDLLDALGVPGEFRLATLQRIHQLGRRLPSPAEVQEVEKGSWLVVLTIVAPVLLYMLKEYVHPVVLQAWNESEVRANLLEFLQAHAFRTAKRKAEEKAIESSRYGNLKVVGVEGDTEQGERPSITIRVERHSIVEVRASDRELVDEFLTRLRRQ